ncbi:hypothetical protein ACHAXA_001400 [Cyclostephanos tholiformis]|uniref:Uncharacterized protein n=1 Tax=Cyclostephanos tholiformis TaxID=382380 RepID=A0ABD3RFI3_9STRA
MAQEREGSRPPVGMVQRMAQERESRPPVGTESGGANRLTKATRRAKINRSNDITGKHLSPPSASNGDIQNTSRYSYAVQITNTTRSEDKPDWAAGTSADSKNESYHVGLHSLLSADDTTVESTSNFPETELEKKFEEAFNITLRTNPGILPGAPAVIDSIKESLLKLQNSRAKKETEMRMQLEKVKNEKDQLEAQLRAEMGKEASRRNELAEQLAARTEEKDLLQNSLNKQIDAIEAMKRELTSKMTDIAKEKEELAKHLGFLSKSRGELEQALETEMKNVQKDRDALQKVLAERKKLQKQKMENKELENKIEIMSNASSKEKKALQAEVAELNKFEDHIKQLRKQNEEAQKVLEEEKKRIVENTETLQSKKRSLAESLKDMEKQFQEEIDELQEKIRHAKMVHEEEMENIVKSRVMTYLKGGDVSGDETKNMLVGRGDATRVMGLRGSGSAGESPLDIDSIVNGRVEAELKRKMWGERGLESSLDIDSLVRERVEAELKKRMLTERAVETTLDIDSIVRERVEAELNKKILEERRTKSEIMEEKKENYPQNFCKIGVQASTKDDAMRREIDRLREELETIQLRKSRYPLPSPIPDQRDDVLKEIQELRHEIKNCSLPSPIPNQREDVLQELQDLRNEISSQNAGNSHRSSFASPGLNLMSPRSPFLRNHSVTPPRFGGVTFDGVGGNNKRLYRGKEDEDDMRMHHRDVASPRAPPGGRSRYYF